nr:class I SAM-dependent methyltransferase [candidate division Zixibacteria bacterium]
MGAKLPVVQKPLYDIQNKLQTHLPHTPEHSLIEIGCAPGGWMAYFHKCFGYRVAGLEYAEGAAEATKTNMKLLDIEASVFVQDFFTYDCEKNKYDIVFSAGFLEHFRDMSVVMNRICALSRKYVVTMVPNVFGINGFISKTIRPRVYAEHNTIDIPILKTLHMDCGMKTLFCDYAGGMRFIMPGAHHEYFTKHKCVAKAMNTPVKIVNYLSGRLSRIHVFTPRSKLLSESILYIGEKVTDGLSKTADETQ